MESKEVTMESDGGIAQGDSFKTKLDIVLPATTLSMPNGPETSSVREENVSRETFLHPVNIDIVITPCDSTVENPYEQTALMTKLIRNHKKMPRKSCRRFLLFSSSARERRLRNAASKKDAVEAQSLIERDPNINLNCADEKRRTPLHISAANGGEEVVRVLLENGASPNLKDTNGNTPLHLAACSGKVPNVTLLLHYGADISATDFYGKTPLHLALGRLRVFHNTQSKHDWELDYLKRRAQIKDIADLLKEYLSREGTEKEREDISMLTKKISNLASEKEVDEVGDLLLHFTEMAIDSKTELAQNKFPSK